MYIEIHNQTEMTQKVLYFKLNNSFNMEILEENNKKIAGIYAIFKDNICLYVGQSKNIASRLATHLKGKYQNFDYIYVWNIENIGFSDFNKRLQQSRISILDNCEKHIMKLLKPIENIIIDMDFNIDEEKTPDIDFSETPCYIIKNNVSSILITDGIYEWDDLIINYGYCLYFASKMLNEDNYEELLSNSIIESFNIHKNINSILGVKQ